jgi:cytoskeletal protein CcmA (bactofilin family)
MGVVRTTLGFLGLGDASEREPVADEPVVRRERGPAIAPEGGSLHPRLVFRGELSGEGDFHILGTFEGEITVSGRVVVAEGAVVDANITAAAIVIGGTVRGNLSATTRVEILPSGVLTGTLRTGSLAAADGASVKGEIWVERGGQTVRSTGPPP